jgi:tricorn protease
MAHPTSTIRRIPELFRSFLLVLLAFAAPAGQVLAQAPDAETLLLQQPAVSAEHVVFVYAQDLWVAGRSGGVARRLTSHVGSETNPHLSPDGRLVAFTAQYEGNDDVYVLPIEGGLPKRLTWHPGRDVVRGWHPDGKRVMFTSDRQDRAPVDRAYLASIDGGNPEALPLPKVSHAAYDPAGARIAYTPVRDAFRSWKRYRGGRTTPVWIFDMNTLEVEQVPHVNASDTFPCWLGSAVWFASDRDGHMNVWRFTPGAKQPEQMTHFTDFDVRNLSAGGGVLAFEQAGAIHLLDPATKQATRLRIVVPNDGLDARPRWQEAKGFVRSAAIAPNGKRAAFEVRGEIVTLPKEHGDARHLTDSAGAHDRDPIWSPDAKKIAWFSDESGEYRLCVRDHQALEPCKAYDLKGGGFYHDAEWSPDGKHILFNDKTNRIAFVTLETGAVTTIGTWQGSLGVVRNSGVWSPDSKWIAFESRDASTTYDRIRLYELATAKTVTLTDGFGSADSPAFSFDGKYLFFRASVDSGPRRFGLDMSASVAPLPTSSLYCAVLQKSERNPVAPKSDEADDPDKPKKDGAESRDAESRPGGEAASSRKAIPAIDPEGLDQRIVALPLAARDYRQLRCTKDKLLFLEVGDEPGSEPVLKSFDFDAKKAIDVAPKVSSYVVSANGKHLLLRSGDEWSLCEADGKEKKALNAAAIKVKVDPVLEWPQILREAWRIERDYFYDPNMHGVDWDAMWKRWSAFLPHVRQRDDLNVVIAEMIGELACGHEYVAGGERPQVPDGAKTGLLGADFTVENGRHRIKTIYKGQNWNPSLRAPLTEPGVEARPGDYLIAVNGRELTGSDNLYAAFVDTANRQTRIKLSEHPDGSAARSITVVPVDGDSSLRHRAWVEANRRRVDELSGGRLAYVHMPDTAAAGLAAFDRDYYSQLDKQGLILDERYNRGGKVADYVISTLSREPMCLWMNREGWVARTPFATMVGPKVMVINEYAGSGGDAMPWLFQRAKIGPLVGTRTWGGLVGISGYPPLMDGGSVTAASFGVMDPDGNWAVENVGVSPDHEVVERPKAIILGGDPQLERAVELALEALEKNPPKSCPTYRPPAAR